MATVPTAATLLLSCVFSSLTLDLSQMVLSLHHPLEGQPFLGPTSWKPPPLQVEEERYAGLG